MSSEQQESIASSSAVPADADPDDFSPSHDPYDEIADFWEPQYINKLIDLLKRPEPDNYLLEQLSSKDLQVYLDEIPKEQVQLKEWNHKYLAGLLAAIKDSGAIAEQSRSLLGMTIDNLQDPVMNKSVTARLKLTARAREMNLMIESQEKLESLRKELFNLYHELSKIDDACSETMLRLLKAVVSKRQVDHPELDQAGKESIVAEVHRLHDDAVAEGPDFKRKAVIDERIEAIRTEIKNIQDNLTAKLAHRSK